jgi:hypothetical protein
MPPVREANGQQLSSNIPIGQWMDARGALASQGLSDQGAGFLSYTPNGRPYYPRHNNWQPRLGMAYSPKGSGALSRFLFGEGKTSIRAGAGMYLRSDPASPSPDSSRPTLTVFRRRSPLLRPTCTPRRSCPGTSDSVRSPRRPMRRSSSNPLPSRSSRSRIPTPSPSPVRWTTVSRRPTP